MYTTLVCDKRTQLAYGILLLQDAINHILVSSPFGDIPAENILQEKLSILRREFITV